MPAFIPPKHEPLGDEAMSDYTFQIPPKCDNEAIAEFDREMQARINEIMRVEAAFIESLIQRVLDFGFKPVLIESPYDESPETPSRLLDADGNVLAKWWRHFEMVDGEMKRNVGGQVTCWSGTWEPIPTGTEPPASPSPPEPPTTP